MPSRCTLGRSGETRFGNTLWSAVPALVTALPATFAAHLIASVGSGVVSAIWAAVPASTTAAAAAAESSALAVSAFGRRLARTRGSRIWDCGVVLLRFRILLKLRLALDSAHRGIILDNLVPLRTSSLHRLRTQILHATVGRDNLGHILVVFFQFHEIGNVEEGVAFQANVNEGRLHAGQHAGHPAFIDGSSEGVFVFAFEVNLCE